MRGQRSRLDDRPDGEIDENFWAQAAAEQAAGQNGEEPDESTYFHPSHFLQIR